MTFCGAANVLICCETRERFAGLLLYCIRGMPNLSDSLITEHQVCLCHYLDVALLVEVLLFVKIDHVLVQMIGRLEILQKSPDTAVFPEPVLSNANVVQRILDSFVAQCLPSVMLEDSALKSYTGSSRLHTSDVTFRYTKKKS